ncbi:MAG: PRC-barrel domain-containing protein [Acidimicrobiales bacterium]
MPGMEDLNQWRGEDVVDTGGDKIGKLEEIYYDSDNDEPVFLGVKTGHLSHHLLFVPYQGVSAGNGHVSTNQAKSVVEKAPKIEPGSELARDQEVEIFEYYNMPYTPSFSSGGRRLVRR